MNTWDNDIQDFWPKMAQNAKNPWPGIHWGAIYGNFPMIAEK
jgi:hypothetical protein